MESTLKIISPCYFTDEEKYWRIEQSLQDAKAGLGCPHNEMFNRHPEWK
jgi:SRSO17 transposase